VSTNSRWVGDRPVSVFWGKPNDWDRPVVQRGGWPNLETVVRWLSHGAAVALGAADFSAEVAENLHAIHAVGYDCEKAVRARFLIADSILWHRFLESASAEQRELAEVLADTWTGEPRSLLEVLATLQPSARDAQH
jgi:hypothetical protein